MNDCSNKQQGLVLIIVLWIIMLGIILVTAIAANIRLSAITVINQQQALKQWSATLEAVSKAHLEIIYNKTKGSSVKLTTAFQEKNSENSFDGRSLDLLYKTPEELNVRITDISGKINIAKLPKNKLEQLLIHITGESTNQLSSLIDAWLDWQDQDNLKRLNGAETEYYNKQTPAYEARNGDFVSVDEVLLIKGFADVFSEFNLDSVFSLYGNKQGRINPNTASKNVLLMIPGIDEQAADAIVSSRETHVFSSLNQLDRLLSPSSMAITKSWFFLGVSNYYAIVIYPREYENSGEKEQVIIAYQEIVKFDQEKKEMLVLQVNPYAEIRISYHP